MADFMPQTVSPDQAEAMARALFSVAAADGHLHPREAQKIREFFAAMTGSPGNLQAVVTAPPTDGAHLASLLNSAELRLLFLRNALLLAYADGVYSTSESRVIDEFARALGISETETNLLEVQVSEFLLSSYPHPLKPAPP